MTKATTVWLFACGIAMPACGGDGGTEAAGGGAESAGGEGEETAPTGGETAAGDPGAGGEQPAGEHPGQGEEHGQDRGVESDPSQSDAPVIDEAGHIGFRADVQMELETLPGTPAEAVQKMGGSVQRRMTEIRACYDRAVASDPEIQGTLKLLLETNARRVVSADVTEAGLERGRITDCVIRILRRLPRGELPASARLWVVLRASNTMAHGMSQVRDVPEGQ